MTEFVYFGYGSNMLTARLKARCNNATPLGVASLSNFSINFSKRSVDQSGKATLVPSNGSVVHGVMFRVPIKERKHLDHAEGLGHGYERLDDVEVANVVAVSTYIALSEQMDEALKPYEWYHALVVAGAEQHALPAAYLARLRRTEFVSDAKLDRKSRLDALCALDATGYPHCLAYPT